MRNECRIDVVRNKVKVKSLPLLQESIPQINMNSAQDIKKELRATYIEDESIDLLRDILVVYSIMDGKEELLGKFIVADAPLKGGLYDVREVTAYDMSYRLQQSKIEQRTTLKAGTKYIDAIKEQFILAGLDDFFIESTGETIQEDREDWEPGTTRMAIVNTLLKEINYYTVWANRQGIVMATRRRRPTITNVDFVYKVGEYEMLYKDYTKKLDLFDQPNVFQLRCENPEKVEMVATSVNDDPASPISTVNIGRRILYTEKVENIASQQALQEMADMMKFEKLLPTEQTVVYTGPKPLHDCFNILALQKSGVDGIYEEIEWTLPLRGAAKMTHKVRRVIAG